MKDKQNIAIGIVVILAIVLISLGAYRHNKGLSVIGDWGNWEQDTPVEGTASQSVSNTTPTPTPPAKKLSYGEAIKAYKYRFQFVNCHGNPGMISVKKGDPVMLDNRDAVAHTIKANGQSFRIAAYDYALVYPSIVTKDNVDLTLSNLTCDGGGAATLNVEK